MTDKAQKPNKQAEEPKPTVVTLVLPADKTKPASVHVQNGDIGHMSTFTYDDFKDIVVALNGGMTAFVEKVVPNPPTHIKNTPSKSTTHKSKKAKKTKKAKAPGKPPFKLMDATGTQRQLNKMFDPFELQERFHKTNPKFQFKTLEEAVEVATILIDAGLEKSIKITYANGKTAQELPAKAEEPISQKSTDKTDEIDEEEEIITTVTDEDADDEQVANPSAESHEDVGDESAEDDIDDEPEDADDDSDDEFDDDGINDEIDEDAGDELEEDDINEESDDNDQQEAIAIPESIADSSDAIRDIYQIVKNSHLAQSIHEAILKGKHHGWKKMKAKQQNVKSIIAMYVDGKEESVEAIYQIALNSFEYDDPPQETNLQPRKQPAPVVTSVTSPELAAEKGIPTHQTFTLATDDDDD